MLRQPTCQKVSLLFQLNKFIFWSFVFILNPRKECAITNLASKALQNFFFGNLPLFVSKFGHFHQIFLIFCSFFLMNSPIVVLWLVFFYSKRAIKRLVSESIYIFDPFFDNSLRSIMFLCYFFDLHIDCVA